MLFITKSTAASSYSRVRLSIMFVRACMASYSTVSTSADMAVHVHVGNTQQSVPNGGYKVWIAMERR